MLASSHVCRTAHLFSCSGAAQRVRSRHQALGTAFDRHKPEPKVPTAHAAPRRPASAGRRGAAKAHHTGYALPKFQRIISAGSAATGHMLLHLSLSNARAPPPSPTNHSHHLLTTCTHPSAVRCRAGARRRRLRASPRAGAATPSAQAEAPSINTSASGIISSICNHPQLSIPAKPAQKSRRAINPLVVASALTSAAPQTYAPS